MIWSRPIPLAWYFNEQWRRFLGDNWVEQQCDQFIQAHIQYISSNLKSAKKICKNPPVSVYSVYVSSQQKMSYE